MIMTDNRLDTAFVESLSILDAQEWEEWSLCARGTEGMDSVFDRWKASDNASWGFMSFRNTEVPRRERCRCVGNSP